MDKHPTIEGDSQAWILFVWCSFLLSITVTAIGLYNAPIDLWIKSFLAMGMLWSIGATFTLAKTVRDNHEARRIINRVVDAKTERILSEYELRKT